MFRGYRVFRVNSQGDLFPINLCFLTKIKAKGNESLCTNLEAHTIENCMCGFHSFKSLYRAYMEAYNTFDRDKYVVCSILHYGDVVETDDGYRSTICDIEQVRCNIGVNKTICVKVANNYKIPVELDSIDQIHTKWEMKADNFAYAMDAWWNGVIQNTNKGIGKLLLRIFMMLMIGSMVISLSIIVIGEITNPFDKVADMNYYQMAEYMNDDFITTILEAGIDETAWNKLDTKYRNLVIKKETNKYLWWRYTR